MPNGKISKAAGTVATVAGIAAGLGAVFWGVPYYIDREVDRQVAAKIQTTNGQLDAIEETAEANAAQLNAINTTLQNLDARMVERDRLFIEYLERQAND